MNSLPNFFPTWRRRLWFCFFASLAVAAGGVIGSGLTVLAFSRSHFPAPQKPEQMAVNMLERMDSLFETSSEEKHAIRKIIERNMNEVKRIRQNSFEQIRAEFDLMQAEVGKVLGSERAATWEKFLADQRKRREERMEKTGEQPTLEQRGGNMRRAGNGRRNAPPPEQKTQDDTEIPAATSEESTASPNENEIPLETPK